MDHDLIARLLALALTQHGLVTSRQAAGLGVTPTMLRNAVRRGWLRPVRRGVYAVVGVAPPPWQPLMAAALAAGPNAVISHRSAAVMHGFYGVASGGPELSLHHGCGRQLAGVRVHQTCGLPATDVKVLHGMRVTTPIRTVIDLAPTLGAHLLGRILDEGAINRLWTAEQVAARLDHLASVRRPGSRQLRSLLDLRVGEGHPDSVLEQRVWRVLRPSVPKFVVHHVVMIDRERFEMDLAWPMLKIDGEVDGMWVRTRSLSKREQECRRENILGAHGWRIVHFTASMDDRELLDQVEPYLPPDLVVRPGCARPPC